MEHSKVNEFLETHGERAARVLSLLGRKKIAVDAIQSEIGQVFLGKSLLRMESILDKIIDEQDTPQDRADFRAHRDLVESLAREIKEYQENLNKVNSNSIKRSKP